MQSKIVIDTYVYKVYINNMNMFSIDYSITIWYLTEGIATIIVFFDTANIGQGKCCWMYTIEQIRQDIWYITQETLQKPTNSAEIMCRLRKSSA